MWSENCSLKRQERESSPWCHVSNGLFKTSLCSTTSLKMPRSEALTLQTKQVQVYTLGKDFLRAAQQLRSPEEKEEHNTFSSPVCCGRCNKGHGSRRNGGLAGGLSINHPGEFPLQREKTPIHFPRIVLQPQNAGFPQ